jgi:hypothetical protein
MSTTTSASAKPSSSDSSSGTPYFISPRSFSVPPASQAPITSYGSSAIASRTTGG